MFWKFTTGLFGFGVSPLLEDDEFELLLLELELESPEELEELLEALPLEEFDDPVPLEDVEVEEELLEPRKSFTEVLLLLPQDVMNTAIDTRKIDRINLLLFKNMYNPQVRMSLIWIYSCLSVCKSKIICNLNKPSVYYGKS